METGETRRLDDYYKIAQEIIESRKERLIRTKAVGSSMYPTVISGDEIFLDSSKNKELVPGDIIVFVRGTSIVCHRIIEVRDVEGQPRYVTQGDSHMSPDADAVGSGQVIGKVVYIIRENIRIDPYSISKRGGLSMLAVSLRVRVRKSFYFFYSSLSKLTKKTLMLLKIYPTFKKIVYWIVRHRVEYFLLLPRQTDDSPIYKYVYIPREAVINKNSGFFEPLHVIGKFKLVANLGKLRLMEIELAKYIYDADTGGGKWAITYYNSRGLFSGGDAERALFNFCDMVLNSIGVREILLLNDKGKLRSIDKSSH